MEPVIQKFRSALSGFNRRDVMQYIEQSAAAHRRKVSELEDRLARVEQERARLEEELSGLQDEKGTVAAEEARVRASLEEATQSLTGLRGELSDTETNLAAAREELERLQGQVGELAPMAQSYGELKDRVATIELDAHRKAQATLDEAQAEAARIREETAAWVNTLMERYGSLRQQMNGVFELARNLSGLEGHIQQMDGMAAQLKDKAEHHG